MPMLAFAGNEATSAYSESHEKAFAPAAPTTIDDSSGTVKQKLMSAQINEKYNAAKDPVPLSDYVNGGLYTP